MGLVACTAPHAGPHAKRVRVWSRSSMAPRTVGHRPHNTSFAIPIEEGGPRASWTPVEEGGPRVAWTPAEEGGPRVTYIPVGVREPRRWNPARGPPALSQIARPRRRYPAYAPRLARPRMPPAVPAVANRWSNVPLLDDRSVAMPTNNPTATQDFVRTRVYGTRDRVTGDEHLHVLHLGEEGPASHARRLAKDKVMHVTEWRPRELQHAPPGLLAAVFRDAAARKFLDRALFENKDYMCVVAMTGLTRHALHQSEEKDGYQVGKKPFHLWT